MADSDQITPMSSQSALSATEPSEHTAPTDATQPVQSVRAVRDVRRADAPRANTQQVNTVTKPVLRKKGQFKRRLKISIDVVMLALFLYLMSYRPSLGLLLHAVLGISLVVLFVLHHALNWNWHRTLFKGKYNLRRSLTSGTDILLLIAMGFTIYSSYLISSMALPFEFLPPPRGIWRDVHMASTAWCFLLMAFHLGLHMHNTLSKWTQSLKAKGTLAVGSFHLLEVVVVLAGAYSLWIHNLWQDIMMVPTPPISMAAPLFYAEYICIIMAFCVVTHYLLNAITPKRVPPRRIKPH